MISTLIITAALEAVLWFKYHARRAAFNRACLHCDDERRGRV